MSTGARTFKSLDVWGPAALAVIAFLVPPGVLADRLASGVAHAASLTLGFWILKFALIAHAGAWWALSAGSREWSTGGSLVPRPSTWARPERVDFLVLAVILLAGAAVRAYQLGEGLWYDEIQTVIRYLTQPITHSLATFESQNQHVLYSLLGRAAVWMFGVEPWAARLPAMVFGVLSLGATWWFGVLVAGRRQALLATAFLSLSYHHVWFSQNARGYTGLLFATLVASGLFVQLIENRRERAVPRLIVMYAASAALGVYIHVTAAVVSIAHAVVWGWLAWSRRTTVNGWARWAPGIAIAAAGGFTILLYSPVLPQLIGTVTAPTMEGVETAWKNPLWLLAETVRGLAAGVPGGVPAVIAGGAIVVVGVASYLRQEPAILGIMVLPALVLAGLVVGMQHNLWPRLFLFSAGFGALIMMRGIADVARLAGHERGPQLALAVSLVAVLGSGWTVPTAWHPKQDYGGARAWVDDQRGTRDAVVTVDMTVSPYRDYLRTGWEAAGSSADLERIENDHDRTWVLYSFPTRLQAVAPDVWERLNEEYVRAAEFGGTVAGGTIVVMVRG